MTLAIALSILAALFAFGAHRALKDVRGDHDACLMREQYRRFEEAHDFRTRVHAKGHALIREAETIVNESARADGTE